MTKKNVILSLFLLVFFVGIYCGTEDIGTTNFYLYDGNGTVAFEAKRLHGKEYRSALARVIYRVGEKAVENDNKHYLPFMFTNDALDVLNCLLKDFSFHYLIEDFSKDATVDLGSTYSEILHHLDNNNGLSHGEEYLNDLANVARVACVVALRNDDKHWFPSVHANEDRDVCHYVCNDIQELLRNKKE